MPCNQLCLCLNKEFTIRLKDCLSVSLLRKVGLVSQAGRRWQVPKDARVAVGRGLARDGDVGDEA